MNITFERDGTVQIHYDRNESIISLAGREAFLGRVEEFNELARQRANDPSLEQEYQDALDVIQGAHNILSGSSFGGLMAGQHHTNQENAALANLNTYAGAAGLTHTQQMRLEQAVTNFLQDQGKRLTPANLDFAIEQIAGLEADAVRGAYGLDPNNQCFLGDTPIQMWPLDPSIKPRADGSYDEAFVLSKVWEKPISEIKVGDIVVAYDNKGRLGPKHVLRTMENRATHILDFWGTGTTPGHAYHCADGPNKGGHAPIMDILRMDGAIMRADGTMIRAATNCKVGSMGDMMIHASATLQKPDGTRTEPKAGKVRFGTRIILPDDRHMSFMEMAASEGWRVSDDGYMVAMKKGEDGKLQEQNFLFPYAHGEELPKPEAYILARSAVTLEEIYAAGEWEQIGTRMPAPAGMVGLNTNHTSTLLQPSKPEPNMPPAFANRPDAPRRAEGRPMNRKQRKAMEAKQRKSTKARKRAVN